MTTDPESLESGIEMEPPLLFNENESLRIENQSLKAKGDKDERRLELYDEEVSRLHEIIRKLKREAFGPRRERWETTEQCLLFNEAETLAKEDAGPSEDKVEVPAHTRTRGKRKPLPENLPREVVVIDLKDSEKFAPDGSPLRVIGKEVSEKLVYEPAVMKVIEYQRLKYGGVEGADTVKIAPVVPCIVPKGIATASLLAHIVTSKFADGLPLYRQEEQFARLGVDIPRSTMGRWIMKAGESCQGIWNALEERLMSRPYVSCDETPVQVLKEEGRTAESKSWMWVRATPSDEKKVVLFDYDPSRSGEVAKRLFADYAGFLQVDGYGAYNTLEKNPGLVRIGCGMHGRRKFNDAAEGAAKGQSLAAEGMAFFQKLYSIEEKAKDLSWDERHALRDREARPLWDAMKQWADKHYDSVPPKSKIGQAFHYFIGEYEYLRAYLLHGMLEMDNGFAERAIKYFAIGRKNWLFSDTVEGALGSSLFYSFVVTAKLNGVDPYQALKRIFEEVPVATTVEDYERLSGILLGLT
jgi:transposase